MMRNIKEFQELIERYRSITGKELLQACIQFKYPITMPLLGYHVMKFVTGFGSVHTCNLCHYLTTEHSYYLRQLRCNKCVWQSNALKLHCCNGKHAGTYLDICNAKNVEDLLEAIKARADYMEEYLSVRLKEIAGSDDSAIALPTKEEC